MATTTIYRPGDRVPTSGIYNVVDQWGTYLGRQETCVEGHRFPPVRRPREYGFVLYRATVHRY